MEIRIAPASGPPPSDRDVEIVERKGLGHPDRICDAVMDRVSVALCAAYRKAVGAIAHHNCDKGTLVAGQAEPRFGGGRILEPMKIIVGDRASRVPGVDVAAVAEGAVRGWFREQLPRVDADRQVQVQIELKPGSAPLAGLFGRGAGVLGANDTSAAVGYAPLTETERLVLEAERWLNAPELKALFPEAGEDVKVMGVRTGRRLELNVAVPLVDSRVRSVRDYLDRKEELRTALGEHLRARLGTLGELEVGINRLDRADDGLAGLYLTVTGTSAEHADSGQVGRGNAVNGLIALHRPRGAEATAGKNPVSHVGKIYGVLSHVLARELQAGVPGVASAVVWMCSRIGVPIDRPWVVSVEVGLAPGAALADVRGAVESLILARLERLPEFCDELARGVHPVC
jgi:S-adenosylmethionine synthetase